LHSLRILVRRVFVIAPTTKAVGSVFIYSPTGKSVGYFIIAPTTKAVGYIFTPFEPTDLPVGAQLITNGFTRWSTINNQRIYPLEHN